MLLKHRVSNVHIRHKLNLQLQHVVRIIPTLVHSFIKESFKTRRKVALKLGPGDLRYDVLLAAHPPVLYKPFK